MRAALLLCVLVVLLSAALGHAQTTPTPSQPLLDLQLYPQNVLTDFASKLPDVSTAGTAQCPGVGTPQFTYAVTTTTVPVNDVMSFRGTNGMVVMEIAHFRVTTTLSYAVTGNKVIQRQDWTRIKENPNGIDNVTGIRHYIGLFQQETQQAAGAARGVVTGTTEGVMTVHEPVSLTGPLAGIATRVDAQQLIGTQPAWLEPFIAQDERICTFLATGLVTPVNPRYNTVCTVDDSTIYTYNGVAFTGNIVGCPAF